MAAGLQGGHREVLGPGEARARTVSRWRTTSPGSRSRTSTRRTRRSRSRSCGTTSTTSSPTDDVDLRNFDADTGHDRRARPDDGRAALPPRPLPAPLLDRPPLRRAEAREAEPERLPGAAGALPDPRAVRPEGRGRARQPLHRLRRSRTTRGSTCRRSAACAGCRRRSAPTRSSGRTPTSTATTATPATSPGWTGSTSASRRSSAPATPQHYPGEVAREGRLGLRRRLGEAARCTSSRASRSCRSTRSRSASSSSTRRRGASRTRTCTTARASSGRSGSTTSSFRKKAPDGGERDRVPGRDGASCPRSSWSTCSSSTRPRRRSRAPLPRRAGLVLQPGREGGHHRRLVHGRGARERRALSGRSIRGVRSASGRGARRCSASRRGRDSPRPRGGGAPRQSRRRAPRPDASASEATARRRAGARSPLRLARRGGAPSSRLSRRPPWSRPWPLALPPRRGAATVPRPSGRSFGTASAGATRASGENVASVVRAGGL